MSMLPAAASSVGPGAASGAGHAAAADFGVGSFLAARDLGSQLRPMPPPDDLPVLKLLQQGDLFGGGGPGTPHGEVPLLVPLTNGAVTNIDFDESYGEPQEALIERYLTLMGLAVPPPPQQLQSQLQPKPQPQQQESHQAAPQPSGRPAAAPDPNRSWPQSPVRSTTDGGDSRQDGRGAGEGGKGREGADQAAQSPDPDEWEEDDDDDLVLSHRREERWRRKQQAAASAARTPGPLEALGLDRPTLTRRGVPEALIGALHRGLAANAAAFFRTCLAEQRRLVALTHGSGPVVPLSDRLLAFITGTEEHLKKGSALPDPLQLRAARDTQAVLDAVSPPRPGAPAPFHHELLHLRQQAAAAASSPIAPPGRDLQPLPAGEGEGEGEDLPLSEPLDLDKITALAVAGNVPGLRALMRSLVSAADYTRSSLQQRLRAEGERAQRECGRATAARQAADKLREQLAARNAALAERGAELEAACRRATAAEEALVTERAIVSGLRGQLRQLTADYEAQHRQLRAGLEAHLTRPASAKLLAKALGHTSPKSEAEGKSSFPGSGFETAAPPTLGSQVSHSADAEVQALGQQLATTRAELALAELTCAQERASGRQLRVMLESSRATVDLHAGRAAAAAAEVERLTRLVAASQDLANASTGGITLLEQQLAQEKAAHRRTTERLQAAAWKFEQARTAVVDVRARAAHNLRKLQTALADVNLRAVTAERHLTDTSMELRHTRGELEGAKSTLEALRDRITRQEAEMEVLRNEAAAARLDSREVVERLRDTETALRSAEARVAQMQQKVMDDAETVMAGARASQRLQVLEKEHAELHSAHQSLRGAHSALGEAHEALRGEMEAARAQIAELKLKETRLEELITAHEELQAAKNRLDQQYAGVLKAKNLLSSELAGLKRHADVLAEQVQEYRRQAEGDRLALEEERELHRHTREELSMTASKRDELDARCVELSAALEVMEVRMTAADSEAQRCRRIAELAGHQRAEAFAMRDALMKVRITLTCDVKEYLATIDGQVRQMTACLAGLRASLTAVQSRLLDMEPATLEGTTAELPKVSYEESQKMIDALFKMVTHGSQLLDTQSEIRKALAERIEQLEDGIKDRLGTATDYWRQVLILSRGSPSSMIQMVEHMTGQACKELELDPANPLSRMVPLGVLEEAGIQLNTQYERAGMLRDRADVSKAKGDAAAKLLEYEREVSSARTAEFQSLVDTLSREVGRLKARVGSLEANNAMQQRATADMQRMLHDAEWKVAKAQEREALMGIKFFVPHGRDTKAVQTVFSDLYMMTAPAAASASAGGAAAAPVGPTTASTVSCALPHHPAGLTPRPHLQHARSLGDPEMAAMCDAGELLCGGADAAATGGGDGGAGGSRDDADSSAAAEAPGSPASLPPLSALSSPATHAAAAAGAWSPPAGSPRNPVPPNGPPSRPQSNLSRASSALPPAPPPLRCTSPDTLPDGASAADVGTGRSTSASAMNSGGGAGGAGVAQQGRPPPPLPQRRRHPDEVPCRSCGSVLSPVPSLNSLHSATSITSDVAAAAAAASASVGAASGTERGYTSEGNAATAALDVVISDDECSSPSPCASPQRPALLRTPSTSATAAAAAAFAANAAAARSSLSTSGPPLHPARPATAGPPTNPWALLPGSHSTGPQIHPHHLHSHPYPHPHYASHPHHHAARLSGPWLHSRPASPGHGHGHGPAPPSPLTPSGIPHGWQHTPWDWLPEATLLARSAVPYSRQALLELIADVHYTKGLHDQVAAAAAFPATCMQQYVGAYYEARHGPRGSIPPVAELALAQLLVSLEAHSALYEVMLFARVAGLQGWISKGSGRNGSHAASRPATAQSLKVSAAGGGFSRPRTPRVDASLSPYTSAGGSGGLSPSRPGTAASARNNRTLSARNSPAAAGGGGQILLGLVPSSRPGTAASPPLAAAAGGPTGCDAAADLSLVPGGETVMRLRSAGGGGGGGGMSPYNSYGSHSHHQLRRAGSAGAMGITSASLNQVQLQQQGVPVHQSQGQIQLQVAQLQLQLPPKPQLRFRPELMVSEQLSQLLGRLGDISGMEALSQFISTGRLLAKLRPKDLGQPLPEETHPELYFTVQRVCGALGLLEAPELLVRQSLPYHADIMLLQLPNLAVSALGLLTGDVDRQPVASLAAAPSAAAGGWKRRAVLLLSPALVAAAAPAALRDPAAPLEVEELQAILGAALAPIGMPGGAGWRLDVQPGASAASGGSGGGGPTSGAASAGTGTSVACSSSSGTSPPAVAAAVSPTLLSAAEVITTVNVAALKPRAVPSVLPSQLQFKWDRLLAHLRSVAAMAIVSADRGALLATQSMAAAVRAVFRAAAGLSVQEGAQLGSGEELLLQAQTLPLSEDQVLGMASMPLHDPAADSGDFRHGYALARVAVLTRWAEAPEYRQTLRSAVM